MYHTATGAVARPRIRPTYQRRGSNAWELQQVEPLQGPLIAKRGIFLRTKWIDHSTSGHEPGS